MAETGLRGRWMRWALVASLAANLVVVGAVAGFALRGGPPAEMRGGPGLAGYAGALPDGHRRALMRDIRGRASEWHAERGELAAAREEMREALVAEPFEPERVAAVLERQRAAQAALAERGGALLAERIERMTPEERAAFAERLERRGDRAGGARRDGGRNEAQPGRREE